MVGVILLIVVGVFWSSSITGNSIWDKILGIGKKSYSPPSKAVTAPSAKSSSGISGSLLEAASASRTTLSLAQFYALTSGSGSDSSNQGVFRSKMGLK